MSVSTESWATMSFTIISLLILNKHSWNCSNQIEKTQETNILSFAFFFCDNKMIPLVTFCLPMMKFKLNLFSKHKWHCSSKGWAFKMINKFKILRNLPIYIRNHWNWTFCPIQSAESNLHKILGSLQVKYDERFREIREKNENFENFNASTVSHGFWWKLRFFGALMLEGPPEISKNSNPTAAVQLYSRHQILSTKIDINLRFVQLKSLPLPTCCSHTPMWSRDIRSVWLLGRD